MFSLINFVKTLLWHEAPTANCAVLQTTLCHATPIVAAIVTRTIAPGETGQIKFQGSWWTARCRQGITLIPGKLVYVVDRQAITLYVEPMLSSSGQGN